MLIGHLESWPPAPPAGDGAPLRYEGIFKGCEFVPKSPLHEAHLLISIRYLNANFTALFWHPSGDLLNRLSRSLKGHEGILMSETGNLMLSAGSGSFAEEA